MKLWALAQLIKLVTGCWNSLQNHVTSVYLTVRCCSVVVFQFTDSSEVWISDLISAWNLVHHTVTLSHSEPVGEVLWAWGRFSVKAETGSERWSESSSELHQSAAKRNMIGFKELLVPFWPQEHFKNSRTLLTFFSQLYSLTSAPQLVSGSCGSPAVTIICCMCVVCCQCVNGALLTLTPHRASMAGSLQTCLTL